MIQGNAPSRQVPGQADERAIRPSLDAGELWLAEPTLTPDAVLVRIQAAYMSGLKRCYVQYLKQDPGARGKVVLSLVVDEIGRTLKGSASGFASEVDACIAKLMPGWRFPLPSGADRAPAAASYAISLQLVPD